MSDSNYQSQTMKMSIIWQNNWIRDDTPLPKVLTDPTCMCQVPEGG